MLSSRLLFRMHTSDGRGPSSPVAIAPVFLSFFHPLPSLYRLTGHSQLNSASSAVLQLCVTGPRTWSLGGASAHLQTNLLWVISSSNGPLDSKGGLSS